MPLRVNALARLLYLCGLVAFPAVSQSLLPADDEASLFSNLRGDQHWPHASGNSQQGYIVWQDNVIDGRGYGIAAQKCDGDGNLIGDIFRVNDGSQNDQEHPQVALLEGGGAMFVWESGKPGRRQLWSRFVNANGAFLGKDLSIGKPSSGQTNRFKAAKWVWRNNRAKRQVLSHVRSRSIRREDNYGASVAALPDGGAVVVYAGKHIMITNATEWVKQVTYRNGKYVTNSAATLAETRADWMHEIFLQRFSAAGKKVGDEVVINATHAFRQHSPRVALLSDGNLAVVWISEHQFANPSSAGVHSVISNPNFTRPDSISQLIGENRTIVAGRIVSVDGVPITDEFRVDGEGAAICATPAINALPAGGCVVAWSRRNDGTNNWDVYSRACASDGTPVGSAQMMNTHARGPQAGPQLASIGAYQMAVWSSFFQDGSGYGVFGRLLGAGVPIGPELAINTKKRADQLEPTVVAMNARFTVVWAHSGRLVEGMELKARHYSPSGFHNAPIAQPSSPSSNTAIIAANGPRIVFTVVGDKASLSWDGTPGGVYQLQVSSDLVSWTNLGEPSSQRSIPSLSLDSGIQSKFYRIVKVP